MAHHVFRDGPGYFENGRSTEIALLVQVFQITNADGRPRRKRGEKSRASQ